MEQIIYNILTYFIVAAAAFVAIRKAYDKLIPKATNQGGCDSGCGGCSSKCDLKDLAAKLKEKE